MGELFSLFPLILQALKLEPQIVTALRTGGSIVDVLQQFGPAVLDIVKQVGSSFFPNLAPDHQVQAAALKMYDTDTVKFIQDAINKLGIATPALVVDGNYGELTKAAVLAFQTKDGVMPADGWAGPVTQAALHNEVNKIAPAPEAVVKKA